ncbi:MAG TPA: single-stranded-DNA-specific exonuclease RecJ, partial [Anaeromyxobacteraceae bacterium]
MEAAWDEAEAEGLVRALGLHPLAARVLAARGLGEPERAGCFLAAGLDDLPDPFLMKGMAAAVERVVRAVEGGERVACYGDYDVDGVTSTALL